MVTPRFLASLRTALAATAITAASTAAFIAPATAAPATAASAVSLPPDVLPENTREVSFAVWLAPRSIGSAGKTVSLFRKDDVGRHGDLRLFLGLRDGKTLAFGVNCGGNYAECEAPVAPDELSNGAWHHVAATFSAADFTMRIFLDGREIGSRERQTPLKTVRDYAPLRVMRDAIAHSNDIDKIPSVVVSGEPLYIGSANGKGEFFDGQLHDAKFLTRALTRAEITAAAENSAPSKPAASVGLSAEALAADASVLQAVRLVAASWYHKRSDFSATLAATIPAGAKTDNRVRVELHRLLRDDFPAETADYLDKWHRSPLDTFLLPKDKFDPEKLVVSVSEYLPLTDLQWSVLSKTERAKWERLRDLRARWFAAAAPARDLAHADAALVADVLFLQKLYEPRPLAHEGVASYKPPSTPATRDRTADEARETLHRDWLFQCDNNPTVERSLQEINWARQLATRIGKSATTTAALARLAALEKTALAKKAAPAQSPAPTSQSPAAKPAPLVDKDLYLAVREAKRAIFFANPVLDFDSVLYTDSPLPRGSERHHETKHRLGYMGGAEGRLLVQKGLGPDAKFTQLAPTAPLHGAFWRPDLSYDASRVLFSFKPHNEKTFHLYEINLDGTGLRQLTGGMFDDLDPVYLPDGKNIMFTTTRGHIYVRCMPPTNAMVTAKMPLDVKPGDKSLYIISRNGEPEYTPSVMSDGRILFTRWEYTDKPLWRAQSLWTMSQNGELVQTFWGNQSVWPDLLKDAREIPGSRRVMFTGSAHHGWFSGCIGILDPAKGLNFPHGLTKVTQELHWPESGNGPTDPKENATYHTSGKYSAYYSPYPLSEKDFLVSARLPGRYGKFVLLLMDTDGNRELINEGVHNIWDALPVRRRPAPPAQPDKLAWPTWETRDQPATGIIYSNNVYEGAPEELRNKAKFLRIWSIEHKTYTYWYKRNYVSSGPEISANQSEGVKKIIGTVPVEPDGSVNFSAPAGIALHFQLLDENHRALQTMKSFTGVQPGEVRGCFGCHEMQMNSAQGPRVGTAMRRRPSPITPVPWEDITVGFQRYVQPGLDKYCGDCHGAGAKAQKKFNSQSRPGFLGFREPYMTLLGNPTWGNAYAPKATPRGGFGWADTILVESYSTVDPAAYATYPPMKRLSYVSRLVKRFDGEKVTSADKHPIVKADSETRLRIKLWVDAMSPYYGSEEVRQMEDPLFQGKSWLSQQPRIHTAPIVQRPGPFDIFHPEEDPAYATPNKNQYNALPSGVKRLDTKVSQR
ncbi:MAG: hypothetical protein LBT53_03325 [Puniceicoccales bacterium]|jgi:hypothetical protein|nr:hypothetical protein [Puniceicoccales bacterium]